MSTSKKIDYVVLGMLKHKNLTGYELKKCFDASIGMFWSASFGSIYPTLASLEKSGMVTRTQSEQPASGRETITYAITQSGLDYLDNWLDIPVDKDEMRCETLLKLFFCSSDDADTALAHIARYEADIRANLADMGKAISSLQRCDDDNHIYIRLSADYGVRMYTMLLEWCVHAREEILNMKERNENGHE